MRKKVFTLFLCMAMILGSSLSAYAEEKIMSDGEIFDAVYYAVYNPDVVNAVGTDENALYQHYVNYGKQEGRLPYASAIGENTTVNVQAVDNSLEIEMAAWGYKMLATRESNNLNSGNLVISRIYTVDISEPNCKNFYKVWGSHSLFENSPHVCIDYTFINDNGAEQKCTAMMGKSNLRGKFFDQIDIDNKTYITLIYTSNFMSSTWKYDNVSLLDTNTVIEKADDLSSSKIYNGTKCNRQGLYDGIIKKL